jgi:CheY-like chemotaxis protein
MEADAVIYSDTASASAANRLEELCREAGFSIERDEIPELDETRDALPKKSSALFLPYGELDCQGVKRIQISNLSQTPHVTCLYGEHLPSASFISLAFREGANDVIALDTGNDGLRNQVQRTWRCLRELRAKKTTESEREQVASARREIASKDRELARMQERYLGMVRSAVAIAQGSLSLEKIRPRLLIASGSDAQAESAKSLASALFFEVEQVTSGAEALAASAKTKFQVILTDSRLPDMDATTLAEKLQTLPKERAVQVVVWSSDEDAEKALLVPGQGFFDCIRKRTDDATALQLAGALLRSLTE